MNITKKILLVEDDPIIAMDEEQVIKGFGYDVISVYSGANAVEYAKNNMIDLVLMDINLGAGISGTEAAKKILESRNIPIVFLSSHSERETVETVRGITRYGYILKDSGAFVFESSIEMAFSLFDAHEKIRINEERLNEAQQIAKIGCWDLDLITNNLVWSDEIYRIFEIEHNSFGASYEAFLATIHPEDRDKVNEAYMNSLKNQSPYSIEHRLLFADGRIKIVLERCETFYDTVGKPVRSIGTVQDVTENELLRQSEEQYRQLYEMESDAVFLIDNYSGRILEANRSATTMYGFSYEELLLSKNSDLSAEPEETQKVTNGTPIIIDNIVTIPLRYHKKKDGTVFPVEITGRFFSRHGRPVHIAAIRDISERKISEDRIKQLLSEKETILREIHHRVMNNIVMIESFISLQTESIKSPEAISALIDTKSRVQSMRLLYDNLYKTDNFSEISARKYFTQLVKLIADLFPDKKSIKIETTFDDFIINQKIIFPLGMIINEIITNSFKHAFVGRNDGMIKISVKKTNASVCAAIEDNGTGLPDDAETKHSGFGLTLIKALSKQLKADLKINVKDGTIFSIIFKL